MQPIHPACESHMVTCVPYSRRGGIDAGNAYPRQTTGRRYQLDATTSQAGTGRGPVPIVSKGL